MVRRLTVGLQNITSPDLGKAGSPYARSVRSDKAMAGAKPDPGLLFDRSYPLFRLRIPPRISAYPPLRLSASPPPPLCSH